MDAAALRAAGDLLRRAKYAVVFTGAGISTPSGIPDFRSPGSGLWTRDDPMQVCSLTAFRHRPEAFFNWLRPLAEMMGKAEPNPAHTGLAKMERRGIIRAVITQNIDGLHQKAGSKEVIELHGSAASLTCLACRRTFTAESVAEEFIQNRGMPACPRCRRLLKPDFVLFEENLPVKAWDTAERHMEQADLVFIVGTALEVYPAAMLPANAAEHGAKIMINTFSNTYLDDRAEVLIHHDVAACMTALVKELGL